MNRFAFVFPGQGSQTTNMLKDISTHSPQISETFSEASEVLGYDLWEVVTREMDSPLNETEYAQPAILTASYAIWKIVQKHMLNQPIVMAGHSLGEYTALVCAGALTFTEAVRLVSLRGKYMQSAVEKGVGKMAAVIGLSNEIVLEICRISTQYTDWILSPANYNSVGQVVIAGHTAAIDKAILLAKEAGAKLAKVLPVSVPSHCLLMQPAVELLKNSLHGMVVRQPEISVIRNVDAKVYQSVDEIVPFLMQQLVKPVRWVETIDEIVTMNVDAIVECGPQKILTGLNKRLDTDAKLYSTADWPSLSLFIESELV